MQETHPPNPGTLPSTRRRRWWIGATLVVLLLAVYAAALTWTTRRLEADIQKSIHALPVVDVARRADD
jgi:hypothetical protein